jgi:hypothetical protein
MQADLLGVGPRDLDAVAAQAADAASYGDGQAVASVALRHLLGHEIDRIDRAWADRLPHVE